MRLPISSFAIIAIVLIGACSAGPDDGTERVDSVGQPIPICGFCFSGPCKKAFCNSSGDCEEEPKPQGTVCRAATDVCDQPEVCDGQTFNCPADSARKPAGTECRAASAACDLAETCDGVNASCPPPGSAVQPAGTVCGCDDNACTSDVCNGTSASCNHFQLPAGAPCGPGLFCGAKGCGPR
jgi:hypothetical protein